MKINDLCQNCGRPASNLHEFSEFSHLRPCAIKDSDGRVRDSVEAVFTDTLDLCYQCYKNAAKKYTHQTQLA